MISLWRRAAQVNQINIRQSCSTRTRGQLQAVIPACLGVHHCLKRGRRRGKHDNCLFELRAHHRHIARMIGDSVFLFIAAIMFFIDDDEFQLMEWQEQGGSRPDYNAGTTMRHFPPRPAAFLVGQAGMPRRRLGTKPHFEPRQNGLRQSNFRQ